MKRHRPVRAAVAASLLVPLALVAVPPAAAEPALVPTSEGQVGETPGVDDKVIGARFVPVRGAAADVLLGGLYVFGGAMPPPPAFSFVSDQIPGGPAPTLREAVAGSFDDVFRLPPAAARSRNAADDGDFVAFAFAVDGSQPQTMSVRLVTFDETGSKRADVTLDDVGTFPDPALNDVGVAIDDQGRAMVVYTDLPPAAPARLVARRFDAQGNPLGGETEIGLNRANPAVALLDPAGDRLIVASSDFGTVRGNILDVSGATPQVLPEFPVSTTPGLANFNPAVAADPATGTFTVAWENVVDVPGDPINVRARRFDAMGNPIGDDFVVNTTTANAQGQPSVAAGPDGETVVVWAGDAANTVVDYLDVFAQAYDAAGQPIGGEVRVNRTSAGVQDRPAVRFLPEPDSLGQPQVAVVWRDVEDDVDERPNGTGLGSRTFSIGEDPSSIFEDGFESGDTSSWSSRKP